MTTTNILPTVHTHLVHPTDGETTLFLVRHGRTASNVEQKFCGHTDDPLDALGLRQAQLVGNRIAQDVRPDVIVTSPLSRALTTARVIGEQLGVEPTVVPGLIEVNFGALEGITFERLQRDYPDLAASFSDPHDDEAGWPDGEKRSDFHRRVFATFQTILAEYARHTVVVVTHGGVLGSFLAQVQGVSPNNPRAYVMANCSLTRIDVSARQTEIHLLNDVVHLEVLASEYDGA